MVWVDSAKLQLKEIIDRIEEDDPDVAKKIFLEIKNKAESLIQNPERGRIVPELSSQSINIYRELIIKPWRLIYRIEGKTVIVFTIIDGRRDVYTILLDMLSK